MYLDPREDKIKQPEEYLGSPTDDADQGGDDEPLISYYKAARAVKSAQQDTIESAAKHLESFGILSMKQAAQEIRGLLLKEATDAKTDNA